MQQYINPFKPTAGKTPLVLAGREQVINDFQEGLEGGPGAMGRLMRITGPRGSGKTVLLSELASLASAQGWTVVNVFGNSELPEAIREQLQNAPSLKGLSFSANAPFVSAEAHIETAQPLSFRMATEAACKGLTKKGKGLLITVDEVQDADHKDMAEVASVVQLMIREDYNIAFVFAGLTTGVLDILNGTAMTFLRRAKPEDLQPIPLDDVKNSLALTIEQSGFEITEEALQLATEATAGYAYLIQLVGFCIWRITWHRCKELTGKIQISKTDAEEGIKVAQAEFNNAVHEPAISGLSKPAIQYLIAMAELPTVASASEIAEKMGKTPGYLSAYRRKLIERQIIEQTAPGYVTFSIPFMREFLLKNKGAILARYGE